MPVNDPIVGIDLGTTNSVVAVADERGEVAVLADHKGFKIQPSVVSFHPDGSVLVGAGAKQRRIIDGKNTVFSAKRLIGRTFDSPEVTALASRLPFVIREADNKQPVVTTRAGVLAIPEISAMVLDHMRKIAERHVGQPIHRAVITVPANFTDSQRSATANAGAIAGMTIPRVLNEPTAAALAYGHERELSRIIAVYDFGGGTFDVSILELSEEVYRVLGTAGNSFLGGDDIDERVVDATVGLFLRKEGIDLRADVSAMQRLRQVAEQIKIELSRSQRAAVTIDEIAYGRGGKPVQLELEMTRDEFIAYAAEIVDATFPVCEEALRLAGLSPAAVGDVVLVGGTTKMPYVRERVAQFFQKAPRTDINPDEAVAVGAALQGLALRPLLGPSERGSRRLAEPPRHGTMRPEVATDVDTAALSVRASDPYAPGASPAAVTLIDRTDGAHVEGHDAGSFDSVTTMEIELPEVTEVMRLGAPISPVTRTGETIEPDLTDTRPRGIRPPPRNLAEVASGEFDLREFDRVGSVSGTIEPALRETRGLTDAIHVLDEPSVQFEIADDDADSSATTELHRDSLPPEDRSIELDLSALDAAFEDYHAAELERQISELISSELSEELSAAPGHTRAEPSGPTPIEGGGVAADPGAGPPVVPTVLEVLPHGLGVSTVAGYCEELIVRNSRVPTETSRIFTTSKNLQRVVRIRVCQGESRRVAENVILGDIVLDGVQPRARGDTRIEITFHVDASGILHVRARDATTGLQQEAYLDIQGAQSSAEFVAAAHRFRQFRT